MERDSFVSAIEAETGRFKTAFLKFLEMDFDYAIKLSKWANELVVKNHVIKYNPAKETVQRQRKNVYWMDFGVNVGSEFNYQHFCVVIREFSNTAIVVPLSTTKPVNASWKTVDNLVVRVGPVSGFPDGGKDCYAMVNQIKTVSKQRLGAFFDKTLQQRLKLKLDDSQMDIIDNTIKLLCAK